MLFFCVEGERGIWEREIKRISEIMREIDERRKRGRDFNFFLNHDKIDNIDIEVIM